MTFTDLLLWSFIPEFLVLVTVLVAYRYGRRSEKLGALIFAGSWSIDAAFQLATRSNLPTGPEIVIEALVALSFIFIGFIEGELWVAFVLMAQSITIGSLGMKLGDDASISSRLMNELGDVSTLLTVIVVVVSVFTSHRRYQVRDLNQKMADEAFEIQLSTVLAGTDGLRWIDLEPSVAKGQLSSFFRNRVEPAAAGR